MVTRLSIVSLIALLAVALVAVAVAQSDSAANVEVRVWQSTEDAESLYISARPEGGSWATLGTIPLDMSGLNSRETFRYGDITLEVPREAPNTYTIDDSEGCETLEAESRWHLLTVLSCRATFLSGEPDGTPTWNLDGFVEFWGTPVPYRGGYLAIDGHLESYGLSISWTFRDGGPCESGIGARIVSGESVYIHPCEAGGSFSTKGDAGVVHSVTGIASFPARTYLYRFRASLDVALSVSEIRWWYLVPVE